MMHRWMISLWVLIVLAAGCRGNAPGGVAVPPTRPSAAAPPQSGGTPGPNGLLLRGATRFVGAESDTVEVTVTVSNPEPRRVRLQVGPCALWVRIAMVPGGDPPRWDSERDRPAAEGAGCGAGGRWLTLLPGDSVAPDELRMRIPVRPVAVSRGFFSITHYFTVTVRLDADTLRLPPIEMGLPKPKYPPPVETVEGVTFRAETRAVRDPKPHVLTTVTVTNTGQGSVWLNGNWCPVKLRAYRSAARSGSPVWLGRWCPEGLPPIVLAPGWSDSLQVRNSMRQILGDSLPAGRYFFTAIVELATPNFQTPELPAGSAMLTR